MNRNEFHTRYGQGTGRTQITDFLAKKMDVPEERAAAIYQENYAAVSQGSDNSIPDFYDQVFFGSALDALNLGYQMPEASNG